MTGRHLQLQSSYAVIGLGWANPTPVNFANRRNGRTGQALVAAAGPVSNVLLAIAGGVVFRVVYSMAPDP
ncbi:MAG: site-2 protease family protein, partial [Candidatus Limnocylindrales bacterium]